jgi:His-Xaa-Ser system protein HxsD
MKIEIDEQIYCVEAVQKAAYRFIDRLTILISKEDSKLICEVGAVEGSQEQFEANIANFKRELLDQQLRKQIKDETEPARNLILAYAFSRTGLQG